jgi:hypothetical protein
MREQRERTWPLPPGGALVRGAGAMCQLTTLTREAITIRVLEWWPDRVGERLLPGGRSVASRRLPAYLGQRQARA